MQDILYLRRAVCVGAGLLLFSTAVLAADGGDHLNVQGTARPDYLPPKRNESFQLPPVEPLSAPSLSIEASTKIKLGRVAFLGNTVFPASELEAIAAPYVGRTISAAELEYLRQLLTRHYIDHGYVNSGVLLAQDSADDVVVFEVIEGKLTGIRLQGMERLDNNYVVRRLTKESDGPLNIDVIRERFQLLLSDPLIQRMNARLMPDTRLGEAILDVVVARARPYQLSASINNYRPPSIGAESFDLSGSVRNLTGQGDLLEASIQNPTNSSGMRGSFAWHMPLGYYGTQLSFAIDHGRSSVIEEPMRTLDIQSTLDSRDIGLSQTLIETLTHKLTLGLNRINRENRTSLLGSPFSFIQGEPEGVTTETLWRFWQEYAHRSETQVLALRSTFTSGKNNNQDIVGLPPTVKPIQRQYSIWLGQVQYARQVLDNGAQIIFRGTTQRTQDRLLPLDGISIGGVNTVRGYRENQLIRDNGEIINLEFEYPLVSSNAHGFKLTVIPFYDIGRGRNNDDSATTISSLGLANRIQWQHFKMDIAIAKRLAFPESIKGSGTTLQDKGIHFQLSYNY